jgi:hypothetical protein
MSLSDAEWGEIVAVRRPRVPKANARAELDRALADYRLFALDPKKLMAARARLSRVIELVRELEAALGAQPKKMIHEDILKGLDRLVSQRRGRANPDQEFLIARLLDVWEYCFRGEPKVTDRTDREPAGDLINFLLIATRDRFDRPINRHTIRNLIRRDRRAKARFVDPRYRQYLHRLLRQMRRD